VRRQKSDNLLVFIDVGHGAHLVLTGLGQEIGHHERLSDEGSRAPLPFPRRADKRIDVVDGALFGRSRHEGGGEKHCGEYLSHLYHFL
jgi:hypothetical protein